MKYKLQQTDTIGEDLKDIFLYIASYSTTKAKGFLHNFNTTAKLLEESPRLGRKLDEFDIILVKGLKLENTHKLIFEDYIIYYSVDDKKQIIYLENIVHSAKEPMQY